MTSLIPEGPEVPPYGHLRLASPEDIMRMGIVYTAGFCDTEKNSWSRRFHQRYPHSTILAQRHDVRDHLLSPNKVVLVVEDKYEPNESSKTWANIPGNNGWTPPEAGKDVIVGAVVWTTAQASDRLGQFWTSSFPALPDYKYEDLDRRRTNKINKVVDEQEKIHLQGDLMMLERIVVHPAYRKRGHGERLARWGLALAAIDKTNIGVVATDQGAALCKRLGFKLLHSVQITDDKDKTSWTQYSFLRYDTAASA